MGVVLVEGISDRIALEAVARRLGHARVDIVPIGGAHAVTRVAAGYPGAAGLCDEGEERYFRAALGDDAVYVCRMNLEDELVRALGPERAEAVIAGQGDLDTFRNFQNQPAWRGRPVDAQMRRWLHAADARATRYPPLFIAALDDDAIPRPLTDVLAHAVAA